MAPKKETQHSRNEDKQEIDSPSRRSSCSSKEERITSAESSQETDEYSYIRTKSENSSLKSRSESHEEANSEEENNENLLEIQVETLTGTTFQVFVSPWETVAGLKGLLERTQGLCSSHQHLLMGQSELSDDKTLVDQGIQDGSSLRLVLRMSGGPISITTNHSEALWEDISKTLQTDKENLLENGEVPEPVTILLLRDENALNLYQVTKNPSKISSPTKRTIPMSSKSIRSEVTSATSDRESLLREKLEHYNKMTDLVDKMKNLRFRKQKTRRVKNSGKNSYRPQSKILWSAKQNNLSKGDEALKRKNAQHDKQILKRKNETMDRSTKSLNPLVQPKDKIGTVVSKRNKSRRNSFISQAYLKNDLTPPNSGLRAKVSELRTQESGSEERIKVSRSTKVLKALPERKYTPQHVQFNHHSKLSAIKARKQIKNVSDSHENLLEKQRRTIAMREKYHSETNSTGRTAPYPMYDKVRELSKNKTNDSKFHLSLTAMSTEEKVELEVRPKTSPENLENSPTVSCSPTEHTLSHTSSFHDDSRIQSRNNCSNQNIRSKIMGEITLTHSSKMNADEREFSCNGYKKGNLSKRVSNSSFKEVNSKVQTIPKTNFEVLNKDVGKELQPELRDENIFDQIRRTQMPKTDRRSNENPDHTKRNRCKQCRKKIGVVNTYQCRCGNAYCTQHRYPETHNCFFDFKAEGRKVIEIANPLVIPSKLPKL